MENEGVSKPGTESQDSDQPGPSEISTKDIDKLTLNIPIPPTKPSAKSPATSVGFKLKTSSKGVENAKKRLRAFSIQKKTPITPVVVNKPLPSVGNSTVLIGKLSGVKIIPKPDDAEQKKLPPKPPKPGQSKKLLQDSYTELQKRTLSEIEDMKRKMELVELGIPLGLICPTSTNEKAMPTKAMPPIKSFLDPAKLDEIINEAKKAKAEGREFKFDYNKLLPDYDNPFQRRKEESEQIKRPEPEKEFYKKIEKDKRKIDRYNRDTRRHSYHRKDDRDIRKEEREKHIEKFKEREEKKDVIKKEMKKTVENETDVNLSDYLVCDSWSLDNDDKNNSPKRHEMQSDDKKATSSERSRESIEANVLRKDRVKSLESPKTTPIRKIEKLQPVIDSFKYEIDPNDDEILDIFDENSSIEKYTKVKQKRDDYDFEKMFDFDNSKDASNDALTDDTFLESVINEIKQEGMSEDEGSHDKGLVEYDSPSRDSSSPKDTRSVTPELDDRMRDLQSSRSDYSDGYRSTESGYKSTESGYKSTESGYKSNSSYKSESRSDNYRMSVEKELEAEMPKCTVDSLETWSFVLKICQPLLFRHDRNKCYRETRAVPKIWFTENPKLCSCVKDREIVYEELETCKMGLVDRVYGCDQIQEYEFPKARGWYPRFAQCLLESSAMPPVAPSTEWEVDDSQTETPVSKDKANVYKTIRSTTPVKNEEIYLDREYQRFMEAVWPEAETSPRSTTPVKQESRKKKAEDIQQEDKKKAKKIKLSSEGWSQESEVEEEVEKTKEKRKIRKRKHSSTSVTDSESNSKKKRKASKKKANKKTKSKLTKRRRLSKKYLKKLKEKQKKKKKHISEDEEIEKENKKKEKKLKKKKLQKKKKSQKKKKAKAKSSSSSSSTSTSETTTDSESDERRKKKKKKSDIKKKKRKQSSSESTQSEDLFDVNILNNIKTERLTDDEKKLEFSPRRQKPREIINVKELQNDFVGSVQIKQEVEEKEIVEKQKIDELPVQKIEKEFVTENAIESNSGSVSEVVTENFTESISDSVSPSVAEETAVECVHQVILENIPIPKQELKFKEPLDVARSIPQDRPDAPQPEESNLSQCSSQESITSKDPYEKDDSHLRPSSQNSNYSFNDVISASQNYQKEEEDKFEPENYEQGNYEMYEQLAMAYQSDVAKQSPADVSSVGTPSGGTDTWWCSQRIETVVRARARGEIKCDWRAGDGSDPTHRPPAPSRPSRWGLKPGEVNIVLTGGNSEERREQYPVQNIVEPVYQIQSIANNRVENTSTGSYDEAYEDMYGASDRLQYGDCFSTTIPGPDHIPLPPTKGPVTSSLDDRINKALRTTVLVDAAKDTEETEADKDGPEKGILITKSESRGAKRVSFADGYKPGQDSDVEEPPKRKKKTRRFGCAWPCPATHPDHVPLWDALPPPPPPPGSPPPPLGQQPPNMLPQLLMNQPPPMLQQQQLLQQQLLQQQGINPAMLQAPPFAMGQKMDPSVSLPNFMPPEPPPGLISFQ